MNKVLITGSQGFIGTYLCIELLNCGYEVIGLDNYSKYGKLIRPHDKNKKFKFYKADVAKEKVNKIFRFEKPDFIISAAAMIGGISYFNQYSYDLLSINEKINTNVFDNAIQEFKGGKLKRIIAISSSMVFEKSNKFPTHEKDLKNMPSPLSTYGFSKLSTEYFCKGAYEQYGLPYTIIRPFNCVGVGEDKTLNDNNITSGNIKLMLSHVVPDLINKCLKGQNPLRILGRGNQVRCYTNGKDIAKAIRLSLESNKAINNDYNISIKTPTTVIELAKLIWKKINPNKKFNFICEKPFNYDVQKRIPDISKAKKDLKFEAKITLEESINEVIEYMKKKN